jgi:hypothetical protein
MDQYSKRATLRLSLIVTVMVALSPAQIAAAVAPQPRCGASWSVVPTMDFGTVASFYGVGATSANDAWAVGNTFDRDVTYTLAEHWDGTEWTVSPTPNPGLDYSGLLGIHTQSAGDAWAVGVYEPSAGLDQTLTEHWDGTTWTAVTSPNVPGAYLNELMAVTSTSGADAWAAGDSRLTGTSKYQNLAEHWDGSSWSLVPTPDVGSADNHLRGVAASSPSDAWAVGWSAIGLSDKTLAMHWDGALWTIVPMPNIGPSNFLNAVTAIGPSDIWAVGTNLVAGIGQTLAEHWDGTSWTVVSTPNVGTSYNYLEGVAAVSTQDIWGVGSYFDGAIYQQLTEHWNGSSWTIVPSPSVGAIMNVGKGAAALASGNVWTVGYYNGPETNGPGPTLVTSVCEVSVSDAGFSPQAATSALGASAFWSFSSSDLTLHSVTDSSGMGLFDSGLKSPGATYSYTFFGAGSYGVVDTITLSTGVVRVPMSVTPKSGGIDTVFTLTWGSISAPIGYLYDVQVKRPNSTVFENLTSGNVRKGSFLPDAGVGTYSFRARLRRATNGKASGWSPAATILVS